MIRKATCVWDRRRLVAPNSWLWFGRFTTAGAGDVLGGDLFLSCFENALRFVAAAMPLAGSFGNRLTSAVRMLASWPK